ncbi:MAG: hypothetical protein AB1779_10465, partial [Candidatus Thermoplasmatota archaeon]
FLIYKDGRLIQHTTRRIKADMDEEILTSMLTAVQTFIKDSLGKEEKAELSSMEYGDNRILFEKGKYVVLASVISGKESAGFREELKTTVNNVESEYGAVLKNWNGDLSMLAGTKKFLTKLGAYKPEKIEEEYEANVEIMSELEFYQGFVRLKVGIKNRTQAVITNSSFKLIYNKDSLRLDRIEPSYAMRGDDIIFDNIEPREKKSCAFYFDPQICTESYIDGILSFKDYRGNLEMKKMRRKLVSVVCPIMYTDENINTAMLKRMIGEELEQRDNKLFSIPFGLSLERAFAIAKRAIQHHDVRFVREFIEKEPFVAEAWFYGKTKERKDKLIIKLVVRGETKTVEFFVASSSILIATGLLAELKNDLDEEMKRDKVPVKKIQQVISEEIREEARKRKSLLDKHMGSEIGAQEIQIK